VLQDVVRILGECERHVAAFRDGLLQQPAVVDPVDLDVLLADDDQRRDVDATEQRRGVRTPELTGERQIQRVFKAPQKHLDALGKGGVGCNRLAVREPPRGLVVERHQRIAVRRERRLGRQLRPCDRPHGAAGWRDEDQPGERHLPITELVVQDMERPLAVAEPEHEVDRRFLREPAHRAGELVGVMLHGDPAEARDVLEGVRAGGALVVAQRRDPRGREGLRQQLRAPVRPRQKRRVPVTVGRAAPCRERDADPETVLGRQHQAGVDRHAVDFPGDRHRKARLREPSHA
jgi:hypothetical protein